MELSCCEAQYSKYSSGVDKEEYSLFLCLNSAVFNTPLSVNKLGDLALLLGLLLSDLLDVGSNGDSFVKRSVSKLFVSEKQIRIINENI